MAFRKILNFQNFLNIKSKLLNLSKYTLNLSENRLNVLKYLIKYPKNFNKKHIKRNNTRGVRDSLRKTLFYLRELEYKIYIPKDVYPTYFEIADSVGIKYDTYTFDNDITNITKIKEKDIVPILTNPIYPYGRYLEKEEINKLIEWVNEKEWRKIFIDSVHHHNRYEKEFKRMDKIVKTGKCIVATSIGKTHIMPETYGTIYPNFNIMVNLHNALIQYDITYGYDNIMRYDLFCTKKTQEYIKLNDDLSERQLNRFDRAWNKLKPILTKIDPNWRKPNSYFSTLPLNHLDLLNKYGILGMPISTLDPNPKTNNKTIITCLDEVIRQDRTMYYVSTISNFCRGYDKYKLIYSKENIDESTFPTKFFLLFEDELEIGIRKARRILKDSNDELILLQTKLTEEEFKNLKMSKNYKGHYIKRNWINIKNIFNLKKEKLIVEDIMAKSFQFNNDILTPYHKLKPLTISILPVAKGCQAKCPFCFSHSSISEDEPQRKLISQLPKIKEMLEYAKTNNAQRAVITGGGEPGLLQHDQIYHLIKMCSTYFNKTVMITNGYMLAKLSEKEMMHALKDYSKSGLNILAVSRHGYNEELNTKLMYLNTNSYKIAQTLNKIDTNITLRWICVLQKGGVHNIETVEKYMDFVKDTKVTQVCFKELYFSTSVESVYHDYESNKWSLENRVPLKLVFDFANKYKFKETSKLPWGAPIFSGNYKDHKVQIAAYTEPSVMWERTNIDKLCRSWNLLATGKCYASLEDRNSEIKIN